MLQLTQSLNNLLEKGAELHHPKGRHPLAYAVPAPDWKKLKLLLLEENGLREWKIVPTAKDYDQATDKLYVAYSDEDYVQLRLASPTDRKANREIFENNFCSCLEQLASRGKTEDWPVQEPRAIQRIVLDSVLEEPQQSYPAGRAMAEQLGNLKLGAALLLLLHIERKGKPLAIWLDACSQELRSSASSV